MLDEVLYMQVRLFRMFCERAKLAPRDGNRVFHEGDIWDFISSCYETLHLSGDEVALGDIFTRLDYLGVAY